MPQVEKYGAQPPIELLRQYMDHQGWYDRKELAFRRIEDVQFCSAMGPPGGGRNHVTNRYFRHYSVVRYAFACYCRRC
jgi:dynein heavy chain, axonemal